MADQAISVSAKVVVFRKPVRTVGVVFNIDLTSLVDGLEGIRDDVDLWDHLKVKIVFFDRSGRVGKILLPFLVSVLDINANWVWVLEVIESL